jgi:hypothetical protein
MSYDLFISYAHKDNERGQVRELCDAIRDDFYQFAGRNLNAFFDEHDIPSMADWESRIAQGLRESRLLLTVLSPNYFASAYCRREWEEYVRYEAMRRCLGEGIAPVYFIELPDLHGSHDDEPSVNAWITELRNRQWCDLLPWHELGKRASEDAHVARRLRVLTGEIKERLSRADRAQQSPTNIYRHNAQFVGRVRELTLLREALNERGGVGVLGLLNRPPSAGATSVHGLGGIGKTELALAYAHAFAWDYPGGRWLARCEGLDDIDGALRQLAEPLNVEFNESEQRDTRLSAERILVELRRRGRSLLLLDNVTHPELIGPDALMRLPPQGHIHVVATTRLGPAHLAGSPHDHTFVAVDELPREDALALIRSHQPDARFAAAEDEAAGRELVGLLGGFTLAVETAAIYLGRQRAAGAIVAYVESLRREPLIASEEFAKDPRVAVRRKEKLLERILGSMCLASARCSQPTRSLCRGSANWRQMNSQRSLGRRRISYPRPPARGECCSTDSWTYASATKPEPRTCVVRLRSRECTGSFKRFWSPSLREEAISCGGTRLSRSEQRSRPAASARSG